MKRICVFLGAAAVTNGIYVQATQEFARAIAARGLHLVYGGGSRGLMGILADAMLAAGGTVTGVIPQALINKEMAHTKLSELIVVSNMLERKRIMLEMSDAFVSLPGGFGTLDEMFEALTWSQLGVFSKPSAILNVNRFFDPLLEWMGIAVEEGFVRQKAHGFLIESEDANTLLDLLLAWKSPGEVLLE
jgi:uncharacterized protein (TIGR00730 family)